MSMKSELTLEDAVQIVRSLARKETGDTRAALDMLADFTESELRRQARRQAKESEAADE